MSDDAGPAPETVPETASQSSEEYVPQQAAVAASLQTSAVNAASSAPRCLSSVLAQEGLTLEEVLPSDAGGWVRMMSALDSEDRSWPFGSLAEVLDPFVLDGASGALGATPRVIKVDVNTDAHGLVSGLSVEVTGSGMTQAQVIGLLGDAV